MITSLRVKIVWSSIFFIIIGGLLATFSVFIFTKNALVDLKKESLEGINKERVKEAEVIFTIAENAIKSISLNESVLDFLYPTESSIHQQGISYKESSIAQQEDPEAEAKSEEQTSLKRDEIMKELSEINLGNIFDIIYLTDPEGNVLVSTDTTLLENNYSFRDYFRGAIESSYFVDFSVGVTTGKPGYYFSKALYKDEGLVGVVVGKMGTKIIEDTVKNNTSYTEADSMILDKMGVIIYSNNPQRIYKSAGPLGIEDKKIIFDTRRYDKFSEIENLTYDFVVPAIKAEENFLSYDFFDVADDKHEIVTMVKIGKFPFYFISEIEKESILGPAVNSSLFLAVLVFLTAAIIATLISYVVYKFLKPIDELRRVAASIGKNNFYDRANVERNDEFGDLAKTLNNTSRQLREMYGEMEKKVKQRTRSFEEANKFMVGRELKMVELKKEIKELKKKVNDDSKK